MCIKSKCRQKLKLTLKTAVSEEILNNLSFSAAELCIHFHWLNRLRQASHRKMIQSSALRLRLWCFKILTCPLLEYRAKNTNSEIDYWKICIANLEEVSTLPKRNFLVVWLKSLTSESTPLATHSFKRSYKINHPAWFWCKK